MEEAHILIDQMDSYFKEAEFVASKIDCECCHGFVTSCEGEACVVDSLCICSK